MISIEIPFAFSLQFVYSVEFSITSDFLINGHLILFEFLSVYLQSYLNPGQVSDIHLISIMVPLVKTIFNLGADLKYQR